MLKNKLDNGLVYYKLSSAELNIIGGLGICDFCNSYTDEGYLIPVLNHYYCKSCFDEWKSKAQKYPEDGEIEKKRCNYYEQMIGLF